MEINRIKKLRVARGLTQAQLAKKAGVSEKSIWNAENNKISPLIMNKIVKGFTKTTEIDEVLKTLSKVVKKEKIISDDDVIEEQFKERMTRNVIRTLKYINTLLEKENKIENIEDAQELLKFVIWKLEKEKING